MDEQINELTPEEKEDIDLDSEDIAEETHVAAPEKTSDDDVDNLQEEIVINENSTINHLTFQLIKALALASEAGNSFYKGHARRTAEYAKEIAKRMGRDEEEQMKIYCAGLIHDIGNTAVHDNILELKAEYTKEERDAVKVHTTEGAKMVKGISEIPELHDAVKYHHERYDGTGYPEGLKGEDIPYVARVVAAAEAYDAMTSERPHRKGFAQYLVREEFVKNRGTQFDPEVSKVVLAMINEDVNYDHRQLTKNEWRILLVDDDPMILKMGEYILSRHKQYIVSTANSGRACLKLLKDGNEFDLIMLDVEMPIMNGIETLIRIRSDKLLANTPVIFVTADNSKETLVNALKHGVNGYITKPFAPHFFLKKLNEVLNKSGE